MSICWHNASILQAWRIVRLFQAVCESAIPKLIGSVLVVHWICHHDHRIWARYIAMCGIIWKLYYRHTRWTPGLLNYSSESSALRETSITVQCFVRVQVVWSNGSKYFMSVCTCRVDDTKRENQLGNTQWFIELMIRSTCFGHYFDHHQELETTQMITACGT